MERICYEGIEKKILMKNRARLTGIVLNLPRIPSARASSSLATRLEPGAIKLITNDKTRDFMITTDKV